MADAEHRLRLEPEKQSLLNGHTEKHFTAGEIVRDIIIGVSDGLTVPFALAAGLSGANASSSIVLTAGIAEVAAGAISMGLGGYLAAKSEADHYFRELKREQDEIVAVPETEAAEVAEILAQYGIEAHEYAPVVNALRKNPQAWLEFMMNLEELSLCWCQKLEFIPPSIGSLNKLCKIDLTYCESLQTLPSSIFKLKLTKLDFHGCIKLRIFPEILEPSESFAHLRLTETAIKEIPSSLEYLAGLQTLQMNLCKDLEFLPNSIGNITFLSKLDFSGCEKLSAIPSDIGRLSLLRELSLHESGIVNLPESIVHLSSLKSLDLSDCKRLESIPELPPFLKHLMAFDCPSIKRVSSSRFKLPSDSNEGIFKFHLTNSQELDPSAQSNLASDAWLRILQDAYSSVLYCFPGSVVPHWFPYHCKGHSVTLNIDTLNLCSDKRIIGFALCVVFGLEGVRDEERRYSVFSYRFTFGCDDGIHVISSHDQLRYYFINWKGRQRFIVNDHTFMWKYYLDSSSIGQMLSHAHNFTFEICKYDVDSFWPNDRNRPSFKVKECGVSPLYGKPKDGTSAGSCEI